MGVYLLFFVIFSFFMFMVARYEITGDWRRMITLMTKYPELEGEIIAAWEKSPSSLPSGDGLTEEGSLDTKELRRMIQLIEEKYGYDLNYTSAAGGTVEVLGSRRLCRCVADRHSGLYGMAEGSGGKRASSGVARVPGEVPGRRIR